MGTIERLGWWLIAYAIGSMNRCDRGHVRPPGDDAWTPCWYCKEFCLACDDWVDRRPSLRDAHWPHPKPPVLVPKDPA